METARPIKRRRDKTLFVSILTLKEEEEEEKDSMTFSRGALCAPRTKSRTGSDIAIGFLAMPGANTNVDGVGVINSASSGVSGAVSNWTTRGKKGMMRN